MAKRFLFYSGRCEQGNHSRRRVGEETAREAMPERREGRERRRSERGEILQLESGAERSFKGGPMCGREGAPPPREQ